MRNERGFSFLEVLIALTVMGVVTTAIFNTYITQHKNYMIQGDVSNIQQNGRASIDELARNIRMAGYDIPISLDAIVASNTNPDTIRLYSRAYHTSPRHWPASGQPDERQIHCC